MFYSLSDFEKELKKRIHEIPSKNAVNKEIKQYFQTKNAQDVSFNKNGRRKLVKSLEESKQLTQNNQNL